MAISRSGSRTRSIFIFANERRVKRCSRATRERRPRSIAAHLQIAVSGLNFERLVKALMGLGEPDAAAIAHHERLFHQFAKVVDDHLAVHPWLANDRLSLADLSIAATMNAPAAQLPVEPYKHLQAFVARLHDRPEWAATA